LEEISLYIFTIVTVFFTFLESMMTQVTPIFSDNIKDLKISAQNTSGTFVAEKQYLQ